MAPESAVYAPGTSTVSFVDGCGEASATISGDTTFSTLSMTTSTGKLYSFQAGSTQMSDSLFLAGAEGNLLRIRSTSAGTAANFDVTGAQSADFVSVQDNNAIGAPIVIAFDSEIVTNAPAPEYQRANRE